MANNFSRDVHSDLDLAQQGQAALNRAMHPPARVVEANVGTPDGLETHRYCPKPERPEMAPCGPGAIDRMIERIGGTSRLDGLLDHLKR